MPSEAAAIYRTCTPVVNREFDPVDGPSLSEAVVEALAAAAGTSPMDLPPLYSIVDLDALSILLSPERTDAKGMFAFVYEDWQIFVSANGSISVCDLTEVSSPAPVFPNRSDQ